MTVNTVLRRLNELSYKGYGDMEVSIYSTMADVSETSCDCLVVDPEIADSVPSATGQWHTKQITVCIM